jgi:hypothetical protein
MVTSESRALETPSPWRTGLLQLYPNQTEAELAALGGEPITFACIRSAFALHSLGIILLTFAGRHLSWGFTLSPILSARKSCHEEPLSLGAVAVAVRSPSPGKQKNAIGPSVNETA